MSFLFPFSETILPGGGDVTILGSTGSIGVNCLAVLDQLKNKDREFRIKSLVAGTNFKKLAAQAEKYNPDAIALYDKKKYHALKDFLPNYNGEILCGEEGVLELASRKSDYVMSAIVGTAGLKPTLAAAQQGTVIGLANKECVVTGGSVFLHEIEKKGAFLFPVDSEHSALYHLMAGQKISEIDKYYITASGGPFRTLPLEDFKNITIDQAVAHPNWSMGQKISVDSATMMNKGLELIEAAYLFDLHPNQIDALIHPQSLVHGMIRNHQGEMMMLASNPDMKIPIWSSLCYGTQTFMQRYFDPLTSFQMGFSPIDAKRYPAFECAKSALQKGGFAPLILNAANEIAVEKFLNKKIEFIGISCFVSDVMDKVEDMIKNESFNQCTIDVILETDQLVRDVAMALE